MGELERLFKLAAPVPSRKANYTEPDNFATQNQSLERLTRMLGRPSLILKICLPLLFLNGPSAVSCIAQEKAADEFSRQDRLRGSITPERAWWDLLKYELSVTFYPEEKRICGSNTIHFRVLENGRRMQIDLQNPLEIQRVIWDKSEVELTREGNVFWLDFPLELEAGEEHQITVDYAGTPVESQRPPWSGGISWKEDENGNHFIATTCQGDGASLWWPCKDHGYDEPDQGIDIRVTVPESLVAVANGRLLSQSLSEDQQSRTFHWQVTQPINNYCVNVNIGDYVQFSDTLDGEGGLLDLHYWVLSHHKEQAQEHFKEAPRTIRAFEHWFGKYPFYEDSYKLVEVPYLGMEHQSSVTYGNGFSNGYKGTDLSGTGVGMLFDFIVVHESGHEWFGNNVSMKDVADMWIHESFTNYSENLFVEYHFSEKEAQDYVIGCRKRVKNDRPIIGTYDVNKAGSGDMYYKGGNMLHAIRHTINDTEKWREILRGLNSTFWHQTVSTQQVENFISQKSGIDFAKFFDQYLRTTEIPKLCYEINGNQFTYWLEDAIEGFCYPVRIKLNDQPVQITPDRKKQTTELEADIESFELDRNFYLNLQTES